jgi:hypothetical protein
MCRSDCTRVRSIQGRGLCHDGKLAIAETTSQLFLSRRAILAGPSRHLVSSS